MASQLTKSQASLYALVLTPLVFWLWAVALAYGWNHFLTPFGAPSITKAHALGLVALQSLALTHRMPRVGWTEAQEIDDICQSTGWNLGMPLAALFMMWVAVLFGGANG